MRRRRFLSTPNNSTSIPVETPEPELLKSIIVPLDREATLRSAERLLRQGKLDAAIAEYQKVIDDQPRDWNTANTLGDLLVRAGRADKAVAQYARIADHLAKEGFYPKASALYKKIIKIKPDDEHALIRAAEISAGQGIVAEAKMYYTAIAERRKARGDRRGAAEMRVRVGALDPDDLEARVIGARANAELGETLAAASGLRDIAHEFAEHGDHDRALGLLEEASALNPADPHARRMLVQAYVKAGDFERVREVAASAPELKQIAGELQARGQQDAALVLLADVLRLDPGDDETRMELMRAHAAGGDVDLAVALAPGSAWLRELAADLMRHGEQERAVDVLAEAFRQDPSDQALKTELARAFVRRGDLTRAAEYLTRAAAGEDAGLLLTYGEVELRRSNADAGLDAIGAALRRDPSRCEEVVQIGWRFCDIDEDVAFRCVELAAATSVEATDFGAAAAAVHEFVTRVPHHIPALMKLVEICVDAGLEATMSEAQAQLADAFLAAGRGSEALAIAEDLVAREPWERANIERFRRALILLGEPDPDAIIAERLSGQSPLVSTDVGRGAEAYEIPAEPPVPARTAEPPAAAKTPPPAAETPLEPVAAAMPAAAKPAPAAVAKAAPSAVTPPNASPAATPAAAKAPPSGSPHPPRPAPASDDPQDDERTFELGPVAIDWTAILGEGHDRGDTMEVDLSGVLADLRPADTPPGGGMDQKSKAPGDLEGVFQEFRDEVSKQSIIDAAEQQFKLGHTYREMGMLDEAIAELQKAARSPRRRFEAASIVARIYKERGKPQQAIDWFERAAEAPAPTVEAGRALLYDLGATLEVHGESARALAVFLELQADAADYRDVRARVDKLTKAQARG